MNIIVVSVLVLGLTGFIFGILLATLSRKLKVEDDERLKNLLDILPGINCGACGFSGCRAFAEAALKKNDIFSGCIPGGEAVNSRIKEVLGLNGSAGERIRRVAVCHCGADKKDKKSSNDYFGPLTCRAADISGGAIDCIYGCVGFGDCEEVCPVGAIKMKERKVYIDINICIGCGKCAEACPRGLFEIIDLPKEEYFYYVSCNNRDKALEVKKVCSHGCIGCGICSRIEGSPFKVENNLSRIVRSKDVSKSVFETAALKCPTKCIIKNDV